jgi:hypothetical protein
MFVRTYRIWCIFCDKILKRKQLSDRWLLFILIAFVLVDIVNTCETARCHEANGSAQGVLILFSLVGNSTVESYSSLTNPATTGQSCRSNYIILYSLFGYKVRIQPGTIVLTDRTSLLGLFTAVHRVLVFHY